MRVLCAGPQTGHGPQAAARHLGGHGTLPHLRRRDDGAGPVQCIADTSLSLSLFSPFSTHLNLPICKPPPQDREHGVIAIIFQENFLSPIWLLSTWDWGSKLLESGCFDSDGSDLGRSRSLKCDSELWWRWCLAIWWCGGFTVGISLLVSSGSKSVRYSYFMFGFGWVYRIWKMFLC